MIPDLIQDKYEHRVGAYLNARLLVPSWTKDFEVGRLQMSQVGLN